MTQALALCKKAYNYSPSTWAFAIFFVFTLTVYRSTLLDIPRSDHVEIFAILRNLSLPSDASRIAFMELLGQSRFQPLAWFVHYFQIKAFGLNFLLYHLAAVGLHAFNGMLVFKLVYSLTHKRLLSFFTALAFVSLFTNLPSVSWPMVSYSLLSTTISLLALLSLLKFYRSSNVVFLYISYALAFVGLFLYELNLVIPAFIFLFSLVMCWSAPKRRALILKNLSLMAVTYLIYAGLYLVLSPQFAGVSLRSLSMWNILKSLAATPIEFFNTVFLHNTFASSQIVIDELEYAVPFTAQSFSLTTMDPLLVKLNFLVYLALFALAIAVRKPYKGRTIWIWLLAAWAFACTAPIFLERSVSYTISQMRHAYFPSIVLVIILAFVYERYFTTKWSLLNSKAPSFIGRYGGAMVLVACLFFVGLNTAKITWTLDDYMQARAYPNAIYYAARHWLAKPENMDNSLFLSITTYPPHEKLQWGTDIIPDLFLKDPRITKNFQKATHILEWKEGEKEPSITEISHISTGKLNGEETPSNVGLKLSLDGVSDSEKKPSISELDHSSDKELNDDFAITFGIMPHPIISEDFLEIFGSSDKPASNLTEKQRWIRLYFDHSVSLAGGEAGRARLVLGYSGSSYSDVTDGWVFRSQPFSIAQSRMNHIILVRENKTFGLIVNGKLVEKVPDITDEDLRNIELPLGEFYKMKYRKPYFYAHTFMEFGRTSYSIRDKEIGYVFENIHFNPMGGKEYHLSLSW